MGRSTVYNKNLTAQYENVCSTNKKLVQDYLLYCKSQDCSPQTIHQYEEWLKVFFCWNLLNNSDKIFPDIKKRDFVYYFGWCRELGMSANRIASLKSVLSSLSNEIELLYEEEYPHFRNLVRTLDPIRISPTREKTVLSLEEVQKILKQLVDLKQYQIACYFALACASGARKAELIQMKVSDFVPEKEVFDGYMYCTSEVRSKGSGKKGKMIHKYVIKEFFEPFFTLWMEERKELNINSEYLFVSSNSSKAGEYTPATISTANTFAQKVSKICGLEFYAHSARHFFCSYLRQMNLPDEAIRLIFSWESTELIKIYDDTPVSDRLNNIFKDFIIKKEKEAKGE